MIGDILSSLCLYWFRTSDRPQRSKLCFGLVVRDPTAPVEGYKDVSCRYRPERHSSVCQTSSIRRPFVQPKSRLQGPKLGPTELNMRSVRSTSGDVVCSQRLSSPHQQPA